MRHVVMIGLIFGSIGAFGGMARADVAACAAAAEHGQDLARAGKVTAAREELTRCASSDCPELIAHDCAGWLASAASRIATASLSVTDTRGDKLASAIVEMDGAPIDWTSPAPLRLDPGVHTFVVKNDGFGTAERRVEFADGSTVAVNVSLTPLLAEPPHEESPQHHKSKPLLFGALGTSGLAIAGFALFAGFGEAGLSEQSDLRGQCAPHCTTGQVDPVSSKFVLANVSAVVGVVAALGAGALWYLYARSDHAEAPPVTSSR